MPRASDPDKNAQGSRDVSHSPLLEQILTDGLALRWRESCAATSYELSRESFADGPVELQTATPMASTMTEVHLTAPAMGEAALLDR